MFYKKGIDITNDRQMFKFLKDHYEYYTLNSWNGLKSIANNVKIYNLNLDGNKWTALDFLRDDEYFTVNNMIRDWEADHHGYLVGFNGRSGGYLVLYSKNNNCNILPNFITDSRDYEDYREYCKDYYGGVKHARSELREYTKLVQDFDKLCDELRDYVNNLSKHDFEDDKIKMDLDNFVYDYKDDMDKLGIAYPSIKGREGAYILISIDSKMRTVRALMDCFLGEIEEEYWSISDDGSSVIRLRVNRCDPRADDFSTFLDKVNKLRQHINDGNNLDTLKQERASLYEDYRQLSGKYEDSYIHNDSLQKVVTAFKEVLKLFENYLQDN